MTKQKLIKKRRRIKKFNKKENSYDNKILDIVNRGFEWTWHLKYQAQALEMILYIVQNAIRVLYGLIAIWGYG